MATYTVQKGDTLWTIAKKFLGNGSEYKKIEQANSLKTGSIIYPGMVLNIPGKTQTTTKNEDIIKAYNKAVQDVDKLPSVQKFLALIGE